MIVAQRRNIYFVTSPIRITAGTKQLVIKCENLGIDLSLEQDVVLFISKNRKRMKLIWIEGEIVFVLETFISKPYKKFDTVFVRYANNSPIVTLTYQELYKIMHGYAIQGIIPMTGHTIPKN